MSFVWEHHRSSRALARGETPLSVHERSVLLCLANAADRDGGNAYPLMRTIADETGVAESTVREICQRLWYLGMVDAERRSGRIAGTRGTILCFTVVMSLTDMTRKRAARQRATVYDETLDEHGPDLDGPDTPLEDPTSVPDGPGRDEAPDDAFDAPGARSADPTESAPAPGAHPEGYRAESALEARFFRAGGADPHKEEPGTGTQEPSSSSSTDLRATGPVDVDDDDPDPRVLDACRLLADRDLADRQAATDHEQVHDPASWRAAALRRRLDDHGPDLARLAVARPDLDPAGLVALHATAGADPRPGAGGGVRRLDDGRLMVPGSGLVAPLAGPPPALTDTERAEGLAALRQIRRPGQPGPDPTEA